MHTRSSSENTSLSQSHNEAGFSLALTASNCADQQSKNNATEQPHSWRNKHYFTSLRLCSRRTKFFIIFSVILIIMIIIIIPAVLVPTLLSQRDRRNEEEARKAGAIVEDGKAEYRGSCANRVCLWQGIRYAAHPVKELRFSPSVDPIPPLGRVTALKPGKICAQSGHANKQAEDCLFANLYRPAGIPMERKLPVLIFIHGGGFQGGSGSIYNASEIITTATKVDMPIVVMTFNYRLGLFGFLAGQEMAQRQQSNHSDVSLNNGFHDMSQAIKWARSHISAFGGDESRITVWGQSAGSFGLSALLIAHPTSPPFVGAFLESGPPSGIPIDPATLKDEQFTRVLEKSKCNNSRDHIACLRGVSWERLRSISNEEANLSNDPDTVLRGMYSWTPVQDGGSDQGGFYSSRASELIASGEYANIPILQGDCLDEGTLFAIRTSNNDSETEDWISRIYFQDPESENSRQLVQEILKAYPDNPRLGSPFSPVGASPDDRFFGPTNQFKRIAAIYGDIRYQSGRRSFLDQTVGRGQKAYSFQFSQHTPKDMASLGVPHGNDLDFFYNRAKTNPFGDLLTRQLVSFVTHQDPSKAPQLPRWPMYSSDGKEMLSYEDGKVSVIKDTYRQDEMDLLNRADILLSTSR